MLTDKAKVLSIFYVQLCQITLPDRSSSDGTPLDRTLSSNEVASSKYATEQSAPQAHSIGRMVDREAKRAEGKGIGYDRWATMHNLKAWSKTFMYLPER